MSEPAVFRTKARPRIIAVLGAVGVICSTGAVADSIESFDGATRIAWATVMVLLTVAIAWLAFWRVPRSGVLVEDGGVTIRGAFTSRTVPWDEIDRFAFTRVAHFGKGLLVTREGALIDMSAITTQEPVDDLNTVLEARRGTQPHAPNMRQMPQGSLPSRRPKR